MLCWRVNPKSGGNEAWSGNVTIRSINPHDPAQIVHEYEPTPPSRVDGMVSAALDAAEAWGRTTAADRSAALSSAARELEQRMDEIVDLEVREIGKPVSDVRAELRRALAVYAYYAQMLLAADGETYPAMRDGEFLFVRRYPVGVVGLIIPWNAPVGIQTWKSVPALAYGNAVVVKPAKESSGIGTLIHEITSKHFPENVVKLVPGDGSTGRALADHPKVAGISFTGSVNVGREVATAVVQRGGKIQCEMGGQNASIVLADANVDAAAKTIARAAMSCAGQKCTSTRRIIVVDDVYEAFRERLVSTVEGLEVMDPLNNDCVVGPLIRQDGITTALEAVAAGGKVVTGGKRLDAAGFYLSPTVVELDDLGGPLARQEVFAPVSALIRARDTEKAIAIANDVEYGLSVAVFTSAIDAVTSYAGRLEAGLVRVNGSTTGIDFHVPFGGIKSSGIGPQEQGMAARDFYTNSRTVLISA
jgi:alpha-ketoglutaric semialdehyde dehydrogenase